ncbi:Spc98 family-domain-containing protein [Ampelomyces quisqualis]|uniref:Spindle pole body component n=1 Tax=Ampelomyces quisqualis TaxID=50730 RepID=A0A6A5QVR3_AMPQU|nr:Spc98 family-domain-containing protein [Ampelomyces quisqualis]
MAQHAKIASLTDELILSVVGFDPATHRQAYKHAKEIASRGLRGHHFGRTNQFQVESTLAGLDEKFRVKNRDDLADALQARLQKLETVTSRFRPDLLSLLLHLTDRPLENTKVEALELLRPPSPDPPLTWHEIILEDPYSDDDIWKDIDYAAESSGDEQVPRKRTRPRASPPISVDKDDTHDPTTCLVAIDEALSQQLRSTQFWSAVADHNDLRGTDVTELQAVRETLFMLAGFQTSLYSLDQQRKKIRINTSYTVGHARASTMEHLLTDFLTIGGNLYRLRQWTKRTSPLPLVQTFEAAVLRRLSDFDRTLAELQQQYLIPGPPIAVSLLYFHTGVHISSAPLCHLAHMVSDIEPELLVNPFSHLEALFDQTTLAQLTLETEKFRYLSQLFFDCLQTYLKPIRNWMENGELGLNDETFFVFENDTSSDVNSLWHDRYVLRRDAHNTLRSPSFLQPAAKKIFNTGKSVVFLKELGLHSRAVSTAVSEPRLDHATVCSLSGEVPLSPFPELFQRAFDHWMQSKYSQASNMLRQHLVDNTGLIRTLVILETLYLGKNGAVFEDLANALFERMDAGHEGWNDRYVLTEMTRGIFATVMPTSDADKIVVRSSKVRRDSQSIANFTAISLDFALSWPIQNVIQRYSIPVYQQVFTLLLQTYRIKYLLLGVRPPRGTGRQESQDATAVLKRKLQHRLLWFADSLRSYLTETAIFFTSEEMYTRIDKADDIDEMAHVHVKYVARLQQRVILSKDVKPIHKAITEILELGVLFSKTITSDDPRTSRNATSKKVKSVWRHGEESSSEAETEENANVNVPTMTHERMTDSNSLTTLQSIDSDFARLLQFVMSGLRSVGRAGAEPMWEQLAERLDWPRQETKSLIT